MRVNNRSSAYHPNSRWAPNLFRTHSVRTPRNTHFKSVPCDHPDIQPPCEAYRDGWQMQLDAIPEKLLPMIKSSGRKWTKVELPHGTFLLFEAGQQCFVDHKVRNDRPTVFMVGEGDGRIFTPRKGTILSEGSFVEHFAEHLEKLRVDREKRDD